MRMANLILTALLAVACSSSYALDVKLAGDISKELEKSCKSDVAKINPLADKKSTAAYCKCYGQETAAGMNDEDLGAMLANRETPHFDSLTNETTTLCSRRHFKAVAKPKYEDIPDIAVDSLIRTKSGVFTAKLTPEMTVIIDSEQAYMVQIKEFFCAWNSEPSMNQSSRETITRMKAVWPAVAKSMMKSPEAQIQIFEETKVRNNPAVFMEITGKRKKITGEMQDIVALVTVVMEIDKSAVVSGFCLTDAVHYDKFKSAMRKLSTAAMSSRIYKN